MKTFDYSLVKDPQYFKDRRMDAHSDHTYYRDGEEAKEKETSFRYDLNGIWQCFVCDFHQLIFFYT